MHAYFVVMRWVAWEAVHAVVKASAAISDGVLSFFDE
jgi:hypothetical protein